MESLDPTMTLFNKPTGNINGEDPGCLVTSGCSRTSLPDVLSNDLTSLNLHGGVDEAASPLLVFDQTEKLSVESASDFCSRLGCDLSSTCKVVSILGNTGEGKSHTLNHTFFNGEEVFPTSSHQDSCTSGVWAAFDPDLQVIVLDTEGMLGLATNENLRTRILLKVLAVSDIVIYRTRAERLHNDLFYFLGDASKAYNKHFSQELSRVGEQNSFVSDENPDDGAVTSLGPSVILFHETLHTDVLGRNGHTEPEVVIRERFRSLKQDISAFSKICYVGTKSGNNGKTNFGLLRDIVGKELRDATVRSPRKVALVHQAFCILNNKFNGTVSNSSHRSFPDEYFTCAAQCQACSHRCTKQMKHQGDHNNTSQNQCLYLAKYENKIYTCRRCSENGRRYMVVPKASSSKEASWLGLAKYAWSGFVLECQKCGVIYRSRQQWYGNTDPEAQGIVHTEIAHVWPGVRSLQGTQNAARRILDGVTVFSGTVSEVSGGPATTLARWAADKVAPAYWRPNSDIVACHQCDSRFNTATKIHHCRACGEGFCNPCSNYQRPCPERGWGFAPVRVCKHCYPIGSEGVLELPSSGEPGEIQARKVGETVLGTVTSLASALEYPINVLKESARPDYWVPDNEITECAVCSISLITNSSASQVVGGVHHCRQCGQGVCSKCSNTRRPVPTRGWDTPVRVCDDCLMMPEN